MSRETALVILRRVQAAFPALTMVLDERHDNVELALDIEAQRGLLFDVHLNLQNSDELYLCAEGFCCSWFPCDDPERADAFHDAVCGLLDGRYRVLEHWRGDRVAKAQLQRPVGTRWKTIATTWPFPPWPWPRKTLKVIQNVAS